MQKKTSLIPSIVVSFSVVLFFFVISKTDLFHVFSSTIQHILSPVQQSLYVVSHQKASQKDAKSDEDRKLTVRFVDQNSLQNENAALKDQFHTTYPVSNSLLPASIIGISSFLPGISQPDAILINRGKYENIQKGFAAVYESNIVGKVSDVSDHISKVMPISANGISFLVKTVPIDNGQKEALGVLKGLGNGQMVMDNVVLSDTLKKDDIVVTKGTVDEHKVGFLPNLVVGKITAVSRTPSNIFQTAQVQSLIHLEQLVDVFILIPQ